VPSSSIIVRSTVICSHRLLHSLAEVPLGVAVSQLERFMLAGGRTAGNGGTAEGAAGESYIGLHGWIPATIKNFARFDLDDC
jgi:hypothetical protein